MCSLYNEEEYDVIGQCGLCEIYIGPYFIEKELKRVKDKYIWVLCNEDGKTRKKLLNPNKEDVVMCGSCFNELKKRQKFILKDFENYETSS